MPAQRGGARYAVGQACCLNCGGNLIGLTDPALNAFPEIDLAGAPGALRAGVGRRDARLRREAGGGWSVADGEQSPQGVVKASTNGTWLLPGMSNQRLAADQFTPLAPGNELVLGNYRLRFVTG